MKHVYVIAEAGVNHNGSLDIAKSLIREAAAAGADAVKFQTFRADTLVSPTAPKADYQKKACGEETQYEMLKRLELSETDHMELKACCERHGVEFLSTPFDVEAADFLRSIGVSMIKLPSGSITDYPLLRKVNGFRTKVLLSTGMATLDEVGEALGVLCDCEVTLLHCTTEYPCPYEHANLRAMVTLRERFGKPVGYSDHTRGIDASIAAAAMGAEMIEKHFTLDCGMDGPDHKASIEPQDMKALVAAVRNVERSLGDGLKVPTPEEMKIMAVARKSIHARRFIRKGETFSEDSIVAKRPGTGMSPMLWNSLIGLTAQRDFQTDEMIEADI